MEYFWLFFSAGSCNDGDCEYSLEKFSTMKELEERLKDIKSRHACDANYRIVKGIEMGAGEW